MFRFRRALPLVLALLLLPLSLQACTPPPPPDDFAYAEGAFSASVRGTYTPAGGDAKPIAADIRIGAPLPEGHPITIRFTQPPALAGVTVTAAYAPEGGDADGPAARTVTFSYPSAYGEITASSQAGEFDGLLRFAEALLPLGDVTAVSPTAEDGTHTVTRRTADGDAEATYLFTRGSSLPLRVTVTSAGERLELVVGIQIIK